MAKRIGIDLGTTRIRIFTPKRGVIIDEPNVVALNVSNQRVISVGTEAKQMLGRTPEAIAASYTLLNGVIASYRSTRQMLQIYLDKVLGRFRLIKPDIVINVPVGATSTEKKAVFDAVESLGARRVYLIKSPLAAAIGAGIDVSSSVGNMIIDVGGGKTEVAVISLGDIVASSSTRFGGKKFDEAIIEHIRKKYSLMIGEQTAESIKTGIGSATSRKKEEKEEVSGSNIITGLPESVMIHTNDIAVAIKPVLNEIILSVKQVLQKTPPELSSDVMDKGIVISGGAAKLANFDELLTKVTGVPCQMAEEPDMCVIKGIGLVLENFEEFADSLIWKIR
ncbi:MAG: rod shape-determining protein [Candidatus Berkelbacteria bacterium]|nr:rod shape-determining protein [Candidatus Berkelbacteria bacterium]